MNPSRDGVFDQCSKRLHGHYPVPVRKLLLELADSVDPGLMPDFFGSGEAVEKLEQKVADLLGKESVLFFPSGTMAQQIALRCWADKTGNNKVGLHLTSHLEQHEENAYQIIHPLKGIIRGNIESPLSITDLQSFNEPLGSVVIELPQRHSGGILPEWQELKEMSRWCKENGTFFHVDGARFWECAPYYGKSYSEIAALFDSVYVSFAKGLGSIGGAALAGPESLIREARIWQRRHGGNLFNLFPLALSSLHGLATRLDRFPAYYAKAKEVAHVISSLSHISVIPGSLQTNMMHLAFRADPQVVEDALLKTSLQTNIFIAKRPWKRSFVEKTVIEIYIGDGAMDLTADEIRGAMGILNDLISVEGRFK
jgi:threonine aldolase